MLKTPPEKFEERMRKPEFAELYNNKPESIQRLMREYPYEIYRVKPNAPYQLTCPNSLVHAMDWLETGDLKVKLFAKDIEPQALDYLKHLSKSSGVSFMRLKATDREAFVKPEWLEPKY